ncbi:MAG: hypothetical protein OEW21_00260 [Betaproteobacteria bacterium]|nr:hypothetical protein [Betaproteobacteria bacterium]
MQGQSHREPVNGAILLRGRGILALVVVALGVAGCSSAPVEPVVEAAAKPATEEVVTPVVTPVIAPTVPAEEIPAKAEPVQPAAEPVPSSQAGAAVPPQPESKPAPGPAQPARYVGYTGAPWGRDYGVVGGHCDPVQALAATGGARAVALFNPGEKFGVAMKDGDRACLGQALELVRKGRSAAWSNAESGDRYRVTVGHDAIDGGLPCRALDVAVAGKDGKSQNIKGIACRQEQATWDFR